MMKIRAKQTITQKIRELSALHGRRVNLHLYDGSIVINVQVVTICSEGREPTLRYKTPSGEGEIRLEEILWWEPLHPVLFPSS
jgi:hypothetical protein